MVLTTEQHGSNSAHIRGGGGCYLPLYSPGYDRSSNEQEKMFKKCRSSFEQIIFAFQSSRKVESRNLFSNKKLHL